MNTCKFHYLLCITRQQTSGLIGALSLFPGTFKDRLEFGNETNLEPLGMNWNIKFLFLECKIFLSCVRRASPSLQSLHCSHCR